MKMTVFMHTIHGKPAFFNGKQITYIITSTINPLRDTLAEIRDEQRKSKAYRDRRKLDPQFSLGYVRFYEE